MNVREASLEWISLAIQKHRADLPETWAATFAEEFLVIAEEYDVLVESACEWIHQHNPLTETSLGEFERFAREIQTEKGNDATS